MNAQLETIISMLEGQLKAAEGILKRSETDESLSGLYSQGFYDSIEMALDTVKTIANSKEVSV